MEHALEMVGEHNWPSRIQRKRACDEDRPEQRRKCTDALYEAWSVSRTNVQIQAYLLSSESPKLLGLESIRSEGLVSL